MITTMNHNASTRWGNDKLRVLLHGLFLNEPIFSKTKSTSKNSLEMTVEYINRLNDEQKKIFECLKNELNN